VESVMAVSLCSATVSGSSLRGHPMWSLSTRRAVIQNCVRGMLFRLKDVTERDKLMSAAEYEQFYPWR
jgi:hypothetical protein